MIRSWATAVLLMGMGTLVAGCASVNPSGEYETLRSSTERFVGHPLVWVQSEQDKAMVIREVERLLEGGLSSTEAVKMALLNNADLQAELEELGVSKAELVQAGLPSNPRVGAVFRFLVGGGATAVEGEGFFPLADVWQIPFRKRLARAKLESTLVKIRASALRIASEARSAHASASLLLEAQKETEALLGRFMEIAQRVKVRRDFGFLTDQDVFMAQIIAAQAEIELERVRNEARRARYRLNRLLGLAPGRSDYTLVPPAVPDPSLIPRMEEAVALALRRRPDLIASGIRIREAQKLLSLERVRFLKVFDAGAGFAREAEGEYLVGPALDLQLPIFDQNTAQIARARHLLKKAMRERESLEQKVREQVLSDISTVRYHLSRLKTIQERMIPLRKQVMEFASKWVGAMQLNRLHLLEAQRGLLESRRELLDARRQLHEALADLWRDMGGGSLGGGSEGHKVE